MRVKKLNVNRRHKPGEDEAAIGVAAGGDSEQRKWVSPTKPLRGGALSGSSSGSSSPAGVQQQPQQQHQGEHSPEHFQTNSSSEFFVRGAGGIAAMPNAAAVDDGKNTERDPMRKAMVARIVEMLRGMKPHAPEKVLAALPRLAQNMEQALFKLAKNKAEYCDLATLRLRIVQIQENNMKRLLAQQQQQTPEQHIIGNKRVTSSLKPLTEKQVRLVYQYLQSWRQKLVNMYGVAPSEVLPNSTLVKVALYMPSTEEELSVCGVESDRITRFGSSLLQELQRLQGLLKSTNMKLIKTKPCRKPPNLGKHNSSEPLTSENSTKKRKNEDMTRLTSMGTSYNEISLTAPAPLLPAVDSLPTLLPTVSMIPGAVTASATATGTTTMLQSQFTPTSGARLFPAQVQPQPLFVPKAPSPVQENHMHLLVQGAGHVSKQRDAKSLEAYEQEVQSLRWMLHQLQQDKLQLETEVQRLRTQLQSANRSK